MCEIPDRNLPGEYPLESLGSKWANAVVFFHNRNGEEQSRIEIIELDSQDRYNQESLFVIAYKCAGMFFFMNPIYFIVNTAFQSIRLFTVPIGNQSTAAFFRQIWHIVKMPFIFIGMQMAALYGILSPLEGRKYFAKLEALLHGTSSRRDALQYLKENPTIESVAKAAFIEEDPKMILFLAYCFQPIGSLNDPHIIQWERIESFPAV